MSSEEENQKLKKKIRELEEALEKERKEKEQIEQEKEQIEQEKEQIEQQFENTKKEFEEFKAKQAHTVSELRKALNIKADKPDNSKQPGLKKGHKGYHRRIPERVDFIKPLIPKRCTHCNSLLEGESQEVRNRYVTDIKLVSKPVTIKYEIHRKYCCNCKKLVEKEVPNALPRARLGLNLMLLVMFLKLGLRLSCEKIVDFLGTSYDVKISKGEVIVILRQLANAFGDYYAHLEKLVRLARVKHTDTIGWRVDGRNYFGMN